MPSTLSKMRPMYYNCYELAHTFDPGCAEGAVQAGCHTFEEAIKIYSTVYLATAILNRKVPGYQEIRSLVLNILQSSLFLSYNSFGYVAAICTFRRLFGFFNYYSVGWFSGFVASLFAIFVERVSRRPMLMVYVAHVATESILASFLHAGMLPRVAYGETILFGMVSAVLLRLYTRRNAGAKAIKGGQQRTRKDITFTVLEQLLGKEKESQIGIQPPSKKKYQSIQSWIQHLFKSLLFKDANNKCAHKNSCVSHTAKGFLRPFLGGTIIQLALLTVRYLQGRPAESNILAKKNFGLGLFLGSFAGIYKFSSCVSRAAFDLEIPEVSGFLAGLSMAFYPSKTIAIYALWKTMDMVFRDLHSAGYLPSVPYVVEVVYAASTGVLFHMGVHEPHILVSSYLKFLQRVTNNRWGEVNRMLLDYQYGTEASKMLKFSPDYQPEFLSEEFKRVMPFLK